MPEHGFLSVPTLYGRRRRRHARWRTGHTPLITIPQELPVLTRLSLWTLSGQDPTHRDRIPVVPDPTVRARVCAHR